MGKFFDNLNYVLAAGVALAIAVMFGLNGQNFEDAATAGGAIMRWLHTFAGILWIGLLYYFNFVQIPTMPTVPAELKPGVSKYIAPAALFYFRWAAAATVLIGLGIAFHAGYGADALMLRSPYTLIGVGMWLGLIMAFNVWFIIWPNQQRALGLVPADDAVKAKSARTAMVVSRTNTLLSIPMLYTMVSFS